LRTGIVEFTGLTDYYRAASDDENGANTSVSWHFFFNRQANGPGISFQNRRFEISLAKLVKKIAQTKKDVNKD
jgi:hypothetical protein